MKRLLEIGKYSLVTIFLYARDDESNLICREIIAVYADDSDEVEK